MEYLKLHTAGKEEHTWTFCFPSMQVLKKGYQNVYILLHMNLTSKEWLGKG